MTTTTIDGVDYGPLAAFVGNWFGDEGLDHSPEPDGSEDSVGDSMGEHIRIGMSHEPPIMRNAHAPKNQGPAFGKLMHVVSNAGPDHGIAGLRSKVRS